jgi:ureidoglycolate lyase
MITLQPAPLTRESFARYGDVIETSADRLVAMNAARFERFDNECVVEARDGQVAISIVRCRLSTVLPYRFDTVERHPHGSQAFVPLTPYRFMVVVAPPEEDVAADDLRAFVTNGRQGVNYHRGTWHMPLIAFDAGQEFLVIDRSGESPNCDEHSLEEAVILAAAGSN